MAVRGPKLETALPAAFTSIASIRQHAAHRNDTTCFHPGFRRTSTGLRIGTGDRLRTRRDPPVATHLSTTPQEIPEALVRRQDKRNHPFALRHLPAQALGDSTSK